MIWISRGYQRAWRASQAVSSGTVDEEIETLQANRCSVAPKCAQHALKGPLCKVRSRLDIIWGMRGSFAIIKDTGVFLIFQQSAGAFLKFSLFLIYKAGKYVKEREKEKFLV